MNTCPHCGAGQRGVEYANEFRCGSYVALRNHIHQSHKCVAREPLFQELRKAKERIAMLETALLPFAQIGDIANDPDCTVWKRAVSAGSVRLARGVLEAKENSQ